MEWLSQNWILLALGIGAIFLMTRGSRAVGGCCGGHGSHDQLEAGKPDVAESGVRHHHGQP